MEDSFSLSGLSEVRQLQFFCGMTVVNYIQKLPILKKVIASILVRLLLALAGASVAEAQNLEIDVHANRISRCEVELTVGAIRTDKTTLNPHVDSLLRRLGNSSASIPFYAVFPAMSPNKPIVMDGLYASPDAFIKSVRSAL